MVKTVVQTVHEDVEEVATTLLLLDVLLVIVVAVAEAGNTWRSDGELVGQFISSCRLAGRRLRVRHRHNTHARTRHTSKRKENGKTKSTSAGGGGEDQKKKKRNHPEMKFFYFFLLSSFSYPGEKTPQKNCSRVLWKGLGFFLERKFK